MKEEAQGRKKTIKNELSEKQLDMDKEGHHPFHNRAGGKKKSSRSFDTWHKEGPCMQR